MLPLKVVLMLWMFLTSYSSCHSEQLVQLDWLKCSNITMEEFATTRIVSDYFFQPVQKLLHNLNNDGKYYIIIPNESGGSPKEWQEECLLTHRKGSSGVFLPKHLYQKKPVALIAASTSQSQIVILVLVSLVVLFSIVILCLIVVFIRHNHSIHRHQEYHYDVPNGESEDCFLEQMRRRENE